MDMKRVQVASNRYRFEVSDSDWERVPTSRLVWMAELLILIRRFEETLIDLKGKDLVHGPVHSSIGQEGVAVGAALALRKTDKIAGTHRAHHQYLAKALCAVGGADFDPFAGGLTQEMRESVRVLLSEIMGLRHGCCAGRGGSMHLYNPDVGVVGTDAIVGGGIPMATGVAWADRQKGNEDVTVCFFGDGAVYQGTLHESANLAALWGAPIVYFIENNKYAVGTNVRQSCSAHELVDIASAYNVHGLQVDGMDPLAVMMGLQETVRLREQGWLPAFIEADTYRFFHHAGGIPGSAYGYRSKEEEQAQRERDPVLRVPERLRRMGLLTEKQEQSLRDDVETCLSAAVSACTVKRGETLVVNETLWPDPADLLTGLPACGATTSKVTLSVAEVSSAQEPMTTGRARIAAKTPAVAVGSGNHEVYVEAEDLSCDTEVTYVESISAVTGRWLERDSCVVVMGEEVENLGGGAYGATKGLAPRFPGRVVNTPISEAGFSGLAGGAAMNGLHPIVEIMFSSFALVAGDQLFNQIGQLSHIYGGRAEIPLVVRTRVAIGLGYGAQHSLDPAALFSLFPGWRVIAPATAFDYIGLFNSAMVQTTPTLIIEHQELYGRKFSIPSDNLEFRVELGKAKTVRRGRDATVLAYSSSVALALAACTELQREGIEAEVLDLRTLDEDGIDYESIGESLKKTGALVLVEQAPACNSIGPRIASECMRRFFDWFDGPPVFVAAPSIPVPVSKRLEEFCIPTVDEAVRMIRAAALRTMP